jgi:Kef-type K+ transport system membrane component KefB
MSYIHLPISNPTWVFFVVLCIILFAPMIFSKLRIPHLIGMILAGVVIGEHGLHLLDRDASFELFGKVGIYYIMFLAGLEMDMQGLKNNRTRGIVFGLLTSLIPFGMGFAAGYWALGYNVAASLLLACIFASHTLVAYPIVGRYGVNRHKSVTVSIAATMIALLFALIILAAIAGTYKGGNDIWFWLLFAVKCVVYFAFMFFLLPRLVRAFYRKYTDAVMQYIFVIAMVFLAAAIAELCGLEGILGAFLAGLVFNKFVPRSSPLMNRIEFVGNAIFIPYFLIGVGMLVNMAPLFRDLNAVIVVVVMVVAGTLSKYVAALLAQRVFKFNSSEGLMMFGLTEAHAAGALAMVMVGTSLEVAPGVPLMDNAVLDGVVMMILISCVISSLATDLAARRIRLASDAAEMTDEEHKGDDEKIMVLLSGTENIENIVTAAVMMRNPKLNRSLIGLNVVYDDDSMETHQENGKRLLEQVTQHAMASNVRVQSQVRIAANIANGIMHAFKEYHCSEVVIGMHSHKEISNKFWGAFHQNLFNGLNRQIIMARLLQPLNTLRYIQIVVPSRAQLEPGFYRWLERMCRLASNLDCRIRFYARQDTMQWITKYVSNRHSGVRAEYEDMEHWNQMPAIASTIADDHLFVVVTARKGTISFKNAQERLPDELTKYFSGKNLMIIFPDQHGNAMEEMNFAQPQLQGGMSAYEIILRWVQGIKHKMAKK